MLTIEGSVRQDEKYRAMCGMSLAVNVCVTEIEPIGVSVEVTK